MYFIRRELEGITDTDFTSEVVNGFDVLSTIHDTPPVIEIEEDDFSVNVYVVGAEMAHKYVYYKGLESHAHLMIKKDDVNLLSGIWNNNGSTH